MSEHKHGSMDTKDQEIWLKITIPKFQNIDS